VYSVLDLGFGSGTRLSESTLAEVNKRNIPNTSYSHTNIGTFLNYEQFELIFSFFHVMGYQTSKVTLNKHP
jgi:hypothetical protein